MEKKKNFKYNILSKENNDIPNLLINQNSFKKSCLSTRLMSSKSNNLNNNTRLTNDTSFNNDDTNKFRQNSRKKIGKDNILINKIIFNSEKLEKKYKSIICPKIQRKLKYINKEELQSLFSDDELNDNYKTIEIEKRKKSLFNSSRKSLTNIKDRRKLMIHYPKNSPSQHLLDANLKSSKYNFTDCNTKNNERKNSVKRFSVTAIFALKISEPSDVLEEHIDPKLKITNKFARFKLLLNKQRDKNVKLLNGIKENRVMNENMLKVYINQLIHKHLSK